MKLKSLLGTALLATSFFLISCGGKDKKEGDDKASTETITKLKNYKRKLIPGTEDYDLVYHRLYEEELIKRGLI